MMALSLRNLNFEKSIVKTKILAEKTMPFQVFELMLRQLVQKRRYIWKYYHKVLQFLEKKIKWNSSTFCS